MDKIVMIRDWSGRRKKVKITNLEQVQEIWCEVISGDEVLTVDYLNGDRVIFDASKDRILDFFDTRYRIPLENLDLFSNQTDSYEAAEVIAGGQNE